MSAIEFLTNVVNNNNLINAQFKYCLMDKNKLPYKYNGSLARPNHKEDFVELNNIDIDIAEQYEGIGISIQSSSISAIDVDKCFSKPFDINSKNQLANEIIEFFKDKAYIEFSFSGSGLRIFFKQDGIENYSENYYTKNSKLGIEFYQPNNSARYVSITGKYIYNNNLTKKLNIKNVYEFLDKYMKKNKTQEILPIIEDNSNINDLMKKVKKLYISNFEFQELWFDINHYKDLSGHSLESDKDYHLLILLYKYITRDKNKLKIIFENSPYFKTKDKKHLKKWNNSDFYFEYQYNYIIKR